MHINFVYVYVCMCVCAGEGDPATCPGAEEGLRDLQERAALGHCRLLPESERHGSQDHYRHPEPKENSW